MKKRAAKTTEFGRRVERVYRELVDEFSAHGAQTWFAAQARVSVRTAQRWFSGDRRPGGPVKALLEQLEVEAGLRKPDNPFPPTT